MSLPIACSLTDSQLQERRRTVLHKVRSAVDEIRELDSGYAYSFPSNGEWLIEVAQLVNLERECCPFLQFAIKVAPDNGPIWLEMTGPEGTKEFLTNTFA